MPLFHCLTFSQRHIRKMRLKIEPMALRPIRALAVFGVVIYYGCIAGLVLLFAVIFALGAAKAIWLWP